MNGNGHCCNVTVCKCRLPLQDTYAANASLGAEDLPTETGHKLLGSSLLQPLDVNSTYGTRD